MFFCSNLLARIHCIGAYSISRFRWIIYTSGAFLRICVCFWTFRILCGGWENLTLEELGKIIPFSRASHLYLANGTKRPVVSIAWKWYLHKTWRSFIVVGGVLVNLNFQCILNVLIEFIKIFLLFFVKNIIV